MFYGCSSLIDLNPLKNWNLGCKDNIEGMFWACSNIKIKIPFSGWEGSLYKYNQMFYDIDGEKKISNKKIKKLPCA